MFKNRLRTIREEMGLNQEEFGKLMRVTQRTQTNYERGLSYPDVLYIELLAQNGADIVYLMTGNPAAIDSLNDDEKELLQNYKMVNQVGKHVLLTVSRSLIKSDDSSDQDGENGELFSGDKKSVGKRKPRISNLMNIARETILNRTIYYSTRLIMPILLAIIGFAAISYIMMIGSNFNAPEYNWLAITAYIVMNVGLVAILSKFIIKKFSLLCEKEQNLES